MGQVDFSWFAKASQMYSEIRENNGQNGEKKFTRLGKVTRNVKCYRFYRLSRGTG